MKENAEIVKKKSEKQRKMLELKKAEEIFKKIEKEANDLQGEIVELERHRTQVNSDMERMGKTIKDLERVQKSDPHVRTNLQL